MQVLDGLGSVGDGAHARHEHIETNTLVQRTALLAGLLTDLAAHSDTPTIDSPEQDAFAPVKNEGVANMWT